MHDWTKVDAGVFHDFHTAWLVEIRNALNGGLLPEGYYALAEQAAGVIGTDVLTLERRTREELSSGDQGGPKAWPWRHPRSSRYFAASVSTI